MRSYDYIGLFRGCCTIREFTQKELAFYNGKDKKPSYVGYEGKVYDLSSGFLWRNGGHQVLHSAGFDLTDSISEAPHGAEFPLKFPVVGDCQKLLSQKRNPHGER